jgi:uncharacterized protein (TIGR02246 family)
MEAVMGRSMLVVVCVSSVLACACAPRVNDPADVQAVRKTMDDYFESSTINDTGAAVAMMTEKTILFEPHMKPLVGKDAIGKMHEAFLSQFKTDAKGPAVDVRVVGDAAIVSMAAESTGTYKGKPFAEKSSGVDFFVRRDGRWQIVNSQMTRVTP